MIDLSIVVPVYNEQDVIQEFHSRLRAVLQGTGMEHEVVFIDDGSQDGTFPLLQGIQRVDPAVRLIQLSRNFGHQYAISAGLDNVSGRACVVMDADLQDPPELIPKMIEKWREGF